METMETELRTRLSMTYNFSLVWYNRDQGFAALMNNILGEIQTVQQA